MSRSIPVSNEDFERLERAAKGEGVTPAEWVARRIPHWGRAEPVTCPEMPPRCTMADVLAGRIGLFSSGHGTPRVEDLPDSLGAYLEAKHGVRNS